MKVKHVVVELFIYSLFCLFGLKLGIVMRSFDEILVYFFCFVYYLDTIESNGSSKDKIYRIQRNEPKG